MGALLLGLRKKSSFTKEVKRTEIPREMFMSHFHAEMKSAKFCFKIVLFLLDFAFHGMSF